MRDYLRILTSALLIKFAGAYVIFYYFAGIDFETFNANKAFWRAEGPDWPTFVWVMTLLAVLGAVIVGGYGRSLHRWEQRLKTGLAPDQLPEQIKRRAATYPLLVGLVSVVTWSVAGWFYARGGLALLTPYAPDQLDPANELFWRAFIGLSLLGGLTAYTVTVVAIERVWQQPRPLAVLVGANLAAWLVAGLLFERGGMGAPQPEVFWRTFLGIGVVGGLTTSTIVFLITDSLWRKHLAVFFPTGGFSQLRVPRVLVGHRLVVTSLLTGLVPLLALGAAALSGTNNLRMVIFFVVIIGISSNILLSLLTTRSLLQPLGYLTNAVDQLGQGRLNLITPIVSNDELGELTHHFKAQLQENSRLLAEIQTYSEEVAEQTEALSQLDKLKDEFLANTSHELRTPLNGIIGLAESLADGATGPLPENTRFNLKMIATSGKRLAALVNDLLDFSKLRHAELELQRRPVDMHQLTELVLVLSRPLAQEKALRLENKIDPTSPAVYGDENRLQQILHNLVGNAIKFSETGVVAISAQVQDNQLEVSVTDTGIGIPADKFESIFKSFEQADASTSRLYGGTGLGLSITRQLVELHGGTIGVESTVGQGSRVSFTLPLSSEPAPLAVNGPEKVVGLRLDREPELVEINPMATGGGGFTILVVDDEPVNRQVLANHLGLENYTVIQATNGLEALQIIRQGPRPDLMLLDIMMPRMSGYQVCEELRRSYPPNELPVVMLTAKDQVSDLMQGFQTGANDYLTKPFSKNELLARIKTHLHLAHINRASDRFVPREFLKFLKKESIVEVNLGDQTQQEMTVLFSDIRSFTTLSEQMTPQENFNFINDYLSRVSPIIRQHGGFIDKYIGDAIMALFPGSPDEAIRAAVEMQQAVACYNLERLDRGETPISIGVGLHTGSVMLGTVGESARMEGTVISDTVNVAARLEGLTKLYGAATLVSEQALFSLDQPTKYRFRYLDKVKVKGKQAAVSIFEILDGNAEE